jgi:hypothetical protein
VTSVITLGLASSLHISWPSVEERKKLRYSKTKLLKLLIEVRHRNELMYLVQ